MVDHNKQSAVYQRYCHVYSTGEWRVGGTHRQLHQPQYLRPHQPPACGMYSCVHCTTLNSSKQTPSVNEMCQKPAKCSPIAATMWYTPTIYSPTSTQGELEGLFSAIVGAGWVRVDEVYYDTGNWCLVATKIADGPEDPAMVNL